MISLVLGVYCKLLDHYQQKWKSDRIDNQFHDWERGQEMRADMGFDDKSFQRIPKRKIKNKAARKKHGY